MIDVYRLSVELKNRIIKYGFKMDKNRNSK